MGRKMKPNLDLPGGSRSRTLSRLLRVAVVIALTGIGGHPARAQQLEGQPEQPRPPKSATGLEGIEILVTPYLWATWIDVGIHPSNSRLPDADETLGFDKIAKHLSWVPFMGEAEIRKGSYGVLIDYLHAPLRAGLNTRDIVFGGGTGGSTLDTGTAMFLYRPIAQPEQYLDVGVGVRAWGLNGDISLNEGLLPATSVTRGVAWADPLIAARYHRELGNGFGLTAYGDFGGFGLGAHTDWQVIGTVDYAIKSWIDLHVGFRSLNFNYSLPRAGLDMNIYGPILALTFRL